MAAAIAEIMHLARSSPVLKASASWPTRMFARFSSTVANTIVGRQEVNIAFVFIWHGKHVFQSKRTISSLAVQ